MVNGLWKPNAMDVGLLEYAVGKTYSMIIRDAPK